jgi:hypothetical protein
VSDAWVLHDTSTVAVVIGGVSIVLPRPVVDAGPPAVDRFLEFVAAPLGNDHTREAYARAAGQFLT